MTIRETLRSAQKRLEDAGVPDARSNAEWLLSEVTGLAPMLLRLQGNDTLSPADTSAFDLLLQRRASREPLQYILGSAWFCGLEFRTDPRALIPRPETELLVERAIALLPEKKACRFLDLCCGSGCIAVALKHRRPAWQAEACDLSSDALALAAENAAHYQTAVRFLQGDLLDAVPRRRYHLILSNPPYIPRTECARLQEEVQREPAMALDGGPDGLDFYRRIARDAPSHLEEGGHLLLELGWQEAPQVTALLAGAGFADICVTPDFQNIDRMVDATWKTNC